MQERDMTVDHPSIKRWAIGFLPLLEKVFREHKHAVSISWRMDETYTKINGAWKYLYRAHAFVFVKCAHLKKNKIEMAQIIYPINGQDVW
jgi:hypothetical protein